MDSDLGPDPFPYPTCLDPDLDLAPHLPQAAAAHAIQLEASVAAAKEAAEARVVQAHHQAEVEVRP